MSKPLAQLAIPIQLASASRCQGCGVTIPIGEHTISWCGAFFTNGITDDIIIRNAALIRLGRIPTDAMVLCNDCTIQYAARCPECGISYIRFPNPTTPAPCPSCEIDKKAKTCCACKIDVTEENSIKFKDKNGVQYSIHKNCVTDKYNIVECGVCKQLYSKVRFMPYHVVCSTKKGKKKYTKMQSACSRCTSDEGKFGICYVCNKKFPIRELTKASHIDRLKDVAKNLRLSSAPICPICSTSAKTECALCEQQMLSKKHHCHNCLTDGDEHFVERDHEFEPGVFYTVGAPPFFGIEIETTGFTSIVEHHKCSKAVYCGAGSYGKTIYQKYDGSINGGIEFCFHPRSIDEWFNETGIGMLTQFREAVVKYGGHAYKTGGCGMHVHRSNDDLVTVDKYGLRNVVAQIRLLSALIAIEPYITILAQRMGGTVVNFDSRKGPPYKVTEYGSWTSIKSLMGEHGLCDLPSVDWYRSVRIALKKLDRKGAVSINTGMPTFEFRFFRGTTDVDVVLANIAFAAIVTDWAQTLKCVDLFRKHNPASAWEMFVEYVTNRAEKQREKHVLHFVKFAKSKKVM